MSFETIAAYLGFGVLVLVLLAFGARIPLGRARNTQTPSAFLGKAAREPAVRYSRFLETVDARLPRDLDLFCVEAFRKEPDKKYLDIIERTYAEIPADELPKLIDRWQGSRRRLYLNYFRRYEQSSDVEYLKTVLVKFPKPVGLFLMNAGSGYVREASIRAWGEKCTVAELPFLLARLNDWVPAIRSAARQQVDRLTADLSDADAIFLISNFYRLSLGKRHEAEGLVERIYARILQNEELLEAVVTGKQVVLARQFLMLAWKDETKQNLLLERVARSFSPILRSLALNLAADNNVSLTRKRAALELFVSDKSPAVRKAYFLLAKQVGGESWQELVSDSLLDVSKGVREIAQFEAKSIFSKEFAANKYVSLLTDEELSPSRQAVAVRGCAETGRALDLNMLRRFLDSSNNALRSAVFVHSNVPAEWAWECFDPQKDCSLKVCRVAADFLKREGGGFSADEVLGAFRRDPVSKRRMAAIGLIAALPFWERLFACLDIWLELPEDRKHQVQSILAGWMARTDIGARPSAMLFERIKKQLATLEHVDDPGLNLSEIKWAIKGWRLE